MRDNYEFDRSVMPEDMAVLCDEFAAQWSQSKRPQIEELLHRVQPEQKPTLFGVLILLELKQRQRLDESPSLQEYIDRFPHYEEVIKTQFREAVAETVNFSIDPEASTLRSAETPPQQEDRSSSVSFQFDDYQILEEISRGGMGIVYKARQLSLNRIVALKLIRAGEFADEDAVRRFRFEAEAAARLDHPNIVPVFEVGEQAGHHFYTMGFIDGPSLSRRVSTGPLPPREAANLIKTTADAVQYAHEQGVVHRDLKPANILFSSLDTGESNILVPRITDFGLAKQLDTDSELTATGQVMGTPSYMPPEQAAGDTSKVGPAADVYALGATLYCLLTGRPPFQAAVPVDTLLQVLNEDPVPPRQLNADVPWDLNSICLKCLEKNPARRYLSAAALAEDLARFLNDQPVQARHIGSSQKFVRWCKRHPSVAIPSMATFALFVALVILTTVGYLREVEQTASLETALSNTQREKKEAERARQEESLARQTVQQQARRLLARQLAVTAQQRIDSKASADVTLLLAAKAVELSTTTGGVPDSVAEHSLNYVIMKASRQVLTNYYEKMEDVLMDQAGKWLAIRNADGRVRLWDLNADQVQANLVNEFGTGRIDKVAISADGSRTAIAFNSRELIVRSFAQEPEDTIRLQVPLTKYIGRIYSPTFMETTPSTVGLTLNPTGRFLVAVAGDNHIWVWDLANPASYQTPRLLGIGARHESFDNLTFSSDGKWLTTGKELFRFHEDGSIGDRVELEALALSNNGKFAISKQAYPKQKDLMLWDMSGDRPLELVSIPNANDASLVCALSSDGEFLITCRRGGVIHKWNLKERDRQIESVKLGENEHSIQKLLLSPDDKWFVTYTISEHDACLLWDLQNSSEVAQPIEMKTPKQLGHRYLIPIGFSPESNQLLTLPYDELKSESSHNSCDTWSWKGGIPVQTALSGENKKDAFYLAALSQNEGRFLVAGRNSGYMAKFKDDGAEIIETFRTTQAMAVEMDRNGNYLAISYEHGGLDVLDLQTQQSIRLPVKFQEGHHCNRIRISPDSQWMVATGTDDSLWIVPLSDLSNIGELSPVAGLQVKAPSSIQSFDPIEFSADGRWLLLSDKKHMVTLLDLSMKVPGTNRLTVDKFGRCRFDPQSRWLVNGRDKLRIWDLRSTKTLVETNTPKDSSFDEFTLDSQILHEPEFQKSGHPEFSPDGRLLAYTEYPQSIHLWSLASNTFQRQETLQTQPKQLYKLFFSPDGRWLLTHGGAKDIHVQLWYLGDPSPKPMLGFELPSSLHSTGVPLFQFSPDSQWLRFIEKSSTKVKLWKLHSDEITEFELEGHKEPISSFAFSSDSRWVGTGSEDTTVRLWPIHRPDVEDASILLPQIEATYQRDQGPRYLSHINHLRFDPQSKWFFCGDSSGKVVLYRLQGINEDLAKMCSIAKHIAGRELTPAEEEEFLLSSAVENQDTPAR